MTCFTWVHEVSYRLKYKVAVVPQSRHRIVAANQRYRTVKAYETFRHLSQINHYYCVLILLYYCMCPHTSARGLWTL
jgi:hypothetical protein